MSTTQATEPFPAQPNIVLTEKQERVRMCLWACLKTPPRFDVKIRPNGIRAAATFDKTAAGVDFEDVESNSNKIRVAAEFDLAVVEVDFERLAASAGLESAGDAEEAWESIKKLVNSGPPVISVSEPAKDAPDLKRKSGHQEELHDAVKPVHSNAPRMGHMGEKISPETLTDVLRELRTPTIKRKRHTHTGTAHDDQTLRARVSRKRVTFSLPLIQFKNFRSSPGSLDSAKPGPGLSKKIDKNPHKAAPAAQLIKHKHDPTIAAKGASSSRVLPRGLRAARLLYRYAADNNFDSTNPNSKSGKRISEDVPFGEDNIPQAPMKRRMLMKEESWKGSQSQ